MAQINKSQNHLVFGTEPFEYQRHIVEHTWNKSWWALFMEMGTGKSKILIDTIVNLYLTGRVDTVLYVAKKGELSNFQVYELPKHKPEHVKCYAYVYRGYTKQEDLTKIKHMLNPSSTHLRVLSINIESLRNQTSKPYAIATHYLRSSKKSMIVVDESTTLKDRRSSQHKALVKLRKLAKYARIMTGTVMPHNPVDVFCQSLFLDKHAMGYGGVTAFKNIYVEQERKQFGARSFMAVTGYKNLDQLQGEMRSIGTVMRKTDCLDLPDKVYKRSAVELTPEQIKHYNDLVDYSLTKIDGEYVECTNALSVIQRLHQIVCGQLRLPTGEYSLIENARYAALKETVDTILESEEKVVVWSHFRAASEGLANYLRQDHNLVHLKGGISIDERAELIEQFKADKSCRIFLGNPQSSGFGLTLTEAHTALYYSNSDNYEHRLQSEDRIHRIGQDQKCLYIDYHTPGTVEDAILDRNKMKALNRDKVMGKNEFAQLIRLR